MKAAGNIATAVCILFFGAVSVPGAAEIELVRAELISEALTVHPGSVVTVALRLEIAEGWHIYWKNPGDSGLPTRVEWILPDGVGASGIAWPAPRIIEDDAALTYGYEGTADLLVEIDVFCGFAGGPYLTIGARVEWLACRDGCIPGSSEVDLVIPVSDHEPLRDSRHKVYFDRVRGDMPRIPRNWQLSAVAESDRIVLSIGLPETPRAVPERVVFFPESEVVVDHGAPQIFREEAGGYVLVMTPSPFAAAPPTRLRGVLTSSNGWGLEEQGSAVLVDVPLTREEKLISQRGSDPTKESR